MAWVSRVSTIRAFIVLIDTQFGALLKQLPNKAQTDALLVDINQAGLSRGLPFELLKPAASESAKEFCPELPMQKQEDRADTTPARRSSASCPALASCSATSSRAPSRPSFWSSSSRAWSTSGSGFASAFFSDLRAAGSSRPFFGRLVTMSP